jgi:hypothetical protein
MSAEPGGIASKLGSQYERQYAVDLALKLANGRLRRMKWEPQSGQAGGADIETESVEGVIEKIQFKRQNGAEGKWSVANLNSENVLSAAASWLDVSPTNRFAFVSSDPVPHIKDICDQLRRHDGEATDFVDERASGNKDRKICFDDLLHRWGLRPESSGDVARAISRLQRMRFEIRDRGEHGENELNVLAQLTLSGDPAVAVAMVQSYVESHLNRDVVPNSLLAWLATKGIKPQDLRRDPALPGAIASLRRDFEQSLRDRLVTKDWLARSHVDQIISKIVSSASPRIVMVHGKPGMGKSSVLLRVSEKLTEAGVAVLPISLAVHRPSNNSYTYGCQLGIGAAPVAALRAVAGNERAVLLVDQLDELRLKNDQSAATWRLCEKILGEALADSMTTLVVACRTFDLENDPNIQRWRTNLADSVLEVNVGDLDAQIVQSVLEPLGVNYGELPSRLQRLLLHPNTLDMWTKLRRRGKESMLFSTTTQVLSRLVDEVRAEASQQHGVSESDVVSLLEAMVKEMESTGTPSVPESKLPDRPVARKALCSAGLLENSGRSYTFPHQSYFDHFVAKSALRETGNSTEKIVAWVKSDQSLQRRDQLRQLLLLLREEQLALLTDVIARLLGDDQVRFHLKLLVLGVLREASSPTKSEVALIQTLSCDPAWWPHVKSKVLWGSLDWFDAINSAGLFRKWLVDTAAPPVQEVMQLLRMAMADRPEAVDALIVPLMSDPKIAKLIEHLVGFDPGDDSPLVSKLREGKVRRGHLSVRDVMLDRLAEKQPGRALSLLDASIRGCLRRLAHEDGNESVVAIRESAVEKHCHNAVRANPAWAWTRFSRLLRLAEKLQISRRARGHTATYSYRIQSVLHDLIEVLVPLVAVAVRGLAEWDRDVFRVALNHRRSELLQVAVAMGLSEAATAVADAAIGWLVDVPLRFSLRVDYQHDPHEVSSKLIQRHSPHCSDGTLAQLERAVLSLHPDQEKQNWKYMQERLLQGKWGYVDGGRYIPYVNSYGRAQYQLLQAIPKERHSPIGRERLKVWANKFQGVADWPDLKGTGGFVGSPIPHERVQCVSDAQWKQTVAKRWDGRRTKQVGPDRLAEANHQQFSRDFEVGAKKDAGRFLSLALDLPTDTPTEYIASVLRAIADSQTDVTKCDAESLERLLQRVLEGKDRNVLMDACRLLSARPEFAWGEVAWKVVELSASHANPSDEEFILSISNSADGMASDLEVEALNCVRGVAAHATRGLIAHDPSRMTRAQALIDTLVTDPHPAVRIAAASIAIPVYIQDKEAGIKLLLQVASHPDDRVLVGRHVDYLMSYIRRAKAGCLEGTFVRMSNSSNQKVARRGAYWITAEWFQSGAVQNEFQRCREGSQAQRLGIARALVDLLDENATYATVVEAELIEMFSDPDQNVRSEAADVFRQEDLLNTAVMHRLAAAFVESPAFLHEAEVVVYMLDEKPLDLVPFAPSIMVIADRFAAELASQTRSFQYSLGMAGKHVSSMLFKLYRSALKAGKGDLAEQCLDRWDRMLQERVGEVERQLEASDEQ